MAPASGIARRQRRLLRRFAGGRLPAHAL